jgi:DNA modification methylase
MSNDLLIVQADARRIPLADAVVQCVVTSPPYWGLRKYAGAQDLIWGGTEGCVHDWNTRERTMTGGTNGTKQETVRGCDWSSLCSRCGAWRGGFGLEPTVEMYIAHTVEILREVRRVLRPDGVVFWNIGDSYASGGNGGHQKGDLFHGHAPREGEIRGKRNLPPGLKPKDLCLIPARVAIAAQADGWWVRSLIIWAKPNPMPESCTDRPTDAYEHIIMLTKSERYFWDADAVREPHVRLWNEKNGGTYSHPVPSEEHGQTGYAHSGPYPLPNPGGRNLRNVWDVPQQPYKGAHFATFPEEIPRRCILAASKISDLILDPFGGSGTTARVAVELNRRAVLLDLAYHDHAEKRTRQVQRRLPS